MAAVLLAAPWVLSQGGHVSVDRITPELKPSQARFLQIMVCLIGLAISPGMTWYGVDAMSRAFKSGTMMRKVLGLVDKRRQPESCCGEA